MMQRTLVQCSIASPIGLIQQTSTSVLHTTQVPTFTSPPHLPFHGRPVSSTTSCPYVSVIFHARSYSIPLAFAASCTSNKAYFILYLHVIHILAFIDFESSARQ